MPRPSTAPPRIALVVDWLCQFGGAEHVIAEIAAVVPQASIFALFDVMAPADRARIPLGPTRTSFLQRAPGIRRYYRGTLPLMPAAIRTLDVRDFDIVISSHHAVAKGVRTHDRQVHLCYCHSPARYAGERRESYLADHGIGGVRAVVARALLERIRRFDERTAAGVDRFLVNSRNVAGRVQQQYGRPSVVVHPPVDLDFFTEAGIRHDGDSHAGARPPDIARMARQAARDPARDPARESDLYVTASRHVPYKRIDRIVEAFRALPHRRLVVLGSGPHHAAIRAAAAGVPNIALRGEVERSELRDWFRRARAFVFAADEDFGIVPLEAQACGTPVIALGRGGALETVRGEAGPDRTGLFFADDAPATIADAVRRFEALTPAPTAAACRTNAERFTADAFRSALRDEVDDAWAAFVAGGRSAARR